MPPPTKARRPHRRSSPRNETPAPGQKVDPRILGGARIEWLDPKIITWPEGRITSDYDEERAAALRSSMEELGQQDAVGVVQLEDESFEGAAGMNRCMAAIETGAATILCVVRQGTHRDVVKANLATSINQSKANPMSEVEGIAHAYDEEDFDLEELVGITGQSEDWIEKRLLISQASPVVKQFLRDNLIGIGHAALLAELGGHSVQEETLHLLLANGWTIKELGDHLQGASPGDAAAGPAPRTQQQRPALVCSYCETERPRADMQSLNVCHGCVDNVKNPLKAAEGQVMAPIDLLKEAEVLLAGSQAGAGVAERIAVLVEGVDEPAPESEPA